MRGYKYYQWSGAEVQKHFDSDAVAGLSDDKASFRLQKYGPNDLGMIHDKPVIIIFLRQFTNFFVWLLLAAATISYFVAGIGEAVILGLIVLANLILGFYQEYKADKALSEIKKTSQTECVVIRDGVPRRILSTEITLGDLICLDIGDRVPADLRLTEEKSLRVDEAALTGESLPVAKSPTVLPIDTALPDRANMLYASTVVASGHGQGVVVAIGKETEFGAIAKLVSTGEDKTPLEKNVDRIAKNISTVAVLASLLILVVGLARGMSLLPLLTFAIALLIAAVPESLPTAITMALALGVSRMAKKKAIVRRLAVIEALGTTDVIASDKTGTLTKNELSVSQIVVPTKSGFTVFADSELKKDLSKSLLQHAVLCSNVSLQKVADFVGDPLETAIVRQAAEVGAITNLVTDFERLFEIPFDSDKGFTAVLVAKSQRKYLIAKGSPETIISFCTLKQDAKAQILAESERLSAAGFRVIALADKHLGSISSSSLKGMTFSGFICFAETLKSGVREAILAAERAGIRPIIITGDHPETARYIAAKAGLIVAPDEVMVGADFESATLAELRQALETVKIFARVSPADKIKIVKMLQDLGHSVAVTGDGVNDAPALKQAEVGIAMGLSGTFVAKDAADIVLADDRYNTIIAAIEYGRAIFDNIRNTIIFLLVVNIAEIVLVVSMFLFGLPLPLTALQLLWINLVIDSGPALALSFAKPEREVMAEPPRKSTGFSRVEYGYIMQLTLLSSFSIFTLFLLGLEESVVKARTLAFVFLIVVNLVFVLSINAKKRFWQSGRSLFGSVYLLVSILFSLLLLLLVFQPFLIGFFSLAVLSAREVVAIILLTLFNFVLAEIIRFRIDKRAQKAYSAIDKQK